MIKLFVYKYLFLNISFGLLRCYLCCLILCSLTLYCLSSLCWRYIFNLYPTPSRLNKSLEIFTSIDNSIIYFTICSLTNRNFPNSSFTCTWNSFRHFPLFFIKCIHHTSNLTKPIRLNNKKKNTLNYDSAILICWNLGQLFLYTWNPTPLFGYIDSN
jgi:hypothetical protein